MLAGLVPSEVHMGRICPGLSPWLVGGSFPRVSSYCLPSMCVSVQISFLYKDTSRTGLEPTLITSRSLGHLYKDTVYKEGHILACEFGGTHNLTYKLNLTHGS